MNAKVFWVGLALAMLLTMGTMWFILGAAAH